MTTPRLTQLITQNAIVSSLLMIALVMLALQLPLAKLDSLIRERQQSQQQVNRDIAASWGGEQAVAGPYLVVPYLEPAPSFPDQAVSLEPRRRFAVFLPYRLNVAAQIQPEVRYRGLFEVPLYQADIQIQAEFQPPDPASPLAGVNLLWQDAWIAVTLTDLKSLTGDISASWNRQSLEVMPGTGASANTVEPGFQFLLSDPFADGQAGKLDIRFHVNGSQRLMFAPLGRRSSIQLQGQWPQPGFQGEWLPSQRTVTEDGFSAQWNIPFIARGMPLQWQDAVPALKRGDLHWVGVQLQPAVDAYRQTDRATKYQWLFLVMIFGFFWLFQVVTGSRLHPSQYLLTGASVSLFYLLLLSLAEHVGFVMAYLCASAAVITQITLYGKTLLRSWKRAAWLAGLLAAMFGFLWSLLQEQDFALLAGSAGLFAALSVVMYFTRNRLQPAA